MWLRFGSARPGGKVLVVQPVEPIAAAEGQTRPFRAQEYGVPVERVAALVGSFKSLGFLRRLPKIEDSGDPETIWWASVALEVSLNDASGPIEFGLGPGGVCGPDSAEVREIFRILLECADVRSDWAELLSGRSGAPT